MKRPPLRSLKFGGAHYRWKVEHDHALQTPAGQPICREVFTAFLDGCKASPVRVIFTATEQRLAGYPQAGVVEVIGGASTNLNTPAAARSLIERALAAGWSPGDSRTPMIVADGFAL